MNLEFTKTDRWNSIVGAMRFVLLFATVGLGVYLYYEIEAVKVLLYNPCEVCMSKTGIQCWNSQGAFKIST